MLFIRLKFLESFKLIIISKRVVVDIVVEMRIVLKGLMPSQEWICKIKVLEFSCP